MLRIMLGVSTLATAALTCVALSTPERGVGSVPLSDEEAARITGGLTQHYDRECSSGVSFCLMVANDTIYTVCSSYTIPPPCVQRSCVYSCDNDTAWGYFCYPHGGHVCYDGVPYAATDCGKAHSGVCPSYIGGENNNVCMRDSCVDQGASSNDCGTLWGGCQ